MDAMDRSFLLYKNQHLAIQVLLNTMDARADDRQPATTQRGERQIPTPLPAAGLLNPLVNCPLIHIN